MSDLINKIFAIKTSKPYIDYKNYHRGNIFGITKMSRRELMHSNFIAWALNPESSHALRFYPIYQLVKSLGVIQGNADNSNARKLNDNGQDPNLLYKFYDENFIIGATVKREHPVPVGNTKKYIDILIEIATTEKVLPIIIENKVESKENGSNGDQTLVYHNWSEQEYSDNSKYYAPIYVYLYPEYNSQMQKAKEYIRMTYQELVDYVIEPSMVKCGDLVSINNYRTYLQCLSFQTDNEKGGETMAISSEEKKIFRAFVEENKELLCAVLGELGELVDIDQDTISNVTNSLKDTTQYQFDGETYGKGRLVLAVVKKYEADNKPACYTDLLAAFPGELQGAKGVVRLANSVSDKDKGINGQKRYFVKANEIITLPSSEKVLVSTEWGITNIDKFVQHVTSKLGYTITKV